MPVTISGNGTITGLSVGGLPDGTVDSDTLAAGAGKGSGRIIKTASYNNTGRTTISNTYTGCGSVTIQPTAATSKMLVLVSFPFGIDSMNANVDYVRANFKLMWNHSGISETQLQHKSYSINFPEDDGMDMILMNSCEIMYLHDHNTPNEITYEIKAKTVQSSSNLEVIQGGSGTDNKTIEVLEIGA